METVRRYYNDNVRLEWERIERHPIEFAVTMHYLDRYIGAGDRVLDVGGGPGRYALHLAARGCEVTLVDLAEENAAFAAREAARQGVPLHAMQGDACRVNELAAGPYDAVLLMGPLYHLTEEAQRAQAMRAALACLRPGGVLYASFLSLYAWMIDDMRRGVDMDKDRADNPEYFRCFAENRAYCGESFTRTCFLPPKEILRFMDGFAVERLHVLSQEGITGPCNNIIADGGAERVRQWTEIALSTCEREEFLAFADHILVIGRKKLTNEPMK